MTLAPWECWGFGYGVVSSCADGPTSARRRYTVARDTPSIVAMSVALIPFSVSAAFGSLI